MTARYIQDYAVVASHVKHGGGTTGVKDAVRAALHTPDVRHAWAAIYTELVMDTGCEFAEAQYEQLQLGETDWADIPDGDLRRDMSKYAAGYTNQRVPNMLDATIDLINRQLSGPILAGLVMSQILDELAGVYGTLQTDGAAALAEHEVVSAGNYGMDLGASFAPVEIDKTWVAVIDEKTRPWHADADGQTVSNDQPFEVGDEEMMYPTDASLGASGKNIYNCRCVSGYLPAAGASRRSLSVDDQLADLLVEMKEWDEDSHPRGADGKFGSGGGSGGRVEGEKLSADSHELQHALLNGGSAGFDDGDPTLKLICHQQGFDGKPTVVSDEELQKAIDNGATSIWRGDAKAEYAEQLREGDYRVGTGRLGNGTYAYGGDMAQAYSRDYSGVEGAAQTHMALDSNARTISSDDAVKLASSVQDEYYDKFVSAMQSGNKEDAETYIQMFQAVRDPGRAAAISGYDAIIESKPVVTGRPEYVVLNRTALLVSPTNHLKKGQ